MRLILFIFLLLNAFPYKKCNAQSIEVDSSFIINKNGVFYQNRKIVDEIGNETMTSLVIGDSTKLFVYLKNSLDLDLFDYIRFASQSLTLRKLVSEKARYLRSAGNIGALILDSIAKKEPSLYTNGYWKINDTGIRFRRTANNWQWRSDTTTQWREMTFFGSVIRLNGLNGYTTELYKIAESSKRFRSANSQFTLQPISSSSRRTVIDPISEGDTEKQKTILVADGTVILNGKKYKYISKSKIWKELK